MPDQAEPYRSQAAADTTTALPHRDDVVYTTRELARLLKVDPSTIRRWRTAPVPQGPAFIALSPRHILYRATDVREWLEQRRVDPRAAA